MEPLKGRRIKFEKLFLKSLWLERIAHSDHPVILVVADANYKEVSVETVSRI